MAYICLYLTFIYLSLFLTLADRIYRVRGCCIAHGSVANERVALLVSGLEHSDTCRPRS